MVKVNLTKQQIQTWKKQQNHPLRKKYKAKIEECRQLQIEAFGSGNLFAEEARQELHQKQNEAKQLYKQYLKEVELELFQNESRK